MPVVLHRPTIGEMSGCSIAAGEPLISVLGPILGARDWQANASFLLEDEAPQYLRVHVANPRWTDIAHPDRLAPDSQRSWEKGHYRAGARKGALGCAMFYIAAEQPDAPVSNPPSRVYGQGTRSEFSEMVGARLFSDHPVNIVLAIDQSHSGHGLHEYQHTARELGIPIHTSLGAACTAAMGIVLSALNLRPNGAL